VNRLTAVAGPSRAGKTALVLDSLIPAARARLTGSRQPRHIRELNLGGIRQVVQIDASPIGQNARSTPATYSSAFDHIRGLYAASAYARRRRWKPGHFSFNTREGQCPACRRLGRIDLDVQYLPDITVQCPTCHGARFNEAVLSAKVDGLTIAEVLGLSVHDAVKRFAASPSVAAALRPVDEVGLGYLKLGEPTPSLSGGESQRLKIASRLRSSQRGALYVFDEPTMGLHPLDVATLSEGVRPAARRRSDDHRHRPRPRPAGGGGLPHRHGTWRRSRRRSYSGRGPASRHRVRRGECHRTMAGRVPAPARGRGDTLTQPTMLLVSGPRIPPTPALRARAEGPAMPAAALAIVHVSTRPATEPTAGTARNSEGRNVGIGGAAVSPHGHGRALEQMAVE
jgi:hypothetical protein